MFSLVLPLRTLFYRLEHLFFDASSLFSKDDRIKYIFLEHLMLCVKQEKHKFAMFGLLCAWFRGF